MTEYYEIVDFEKLTYADFFKRYFPEMCKKHSFDTDGFVNDTECYTFVCDVRNYILVKRGYMRSMDRSYRIEIEEQMERLLKEKGWEKFPFEFVSPFDDESQLSFVMIGSLKKKVVGNIIGNAILHPVTL